MSGVHGERFPTCMEFGENATIPKCNKPGCPGNKTWADIFPAQSTPSQADEITAFREENWTREALAETIHKARWPADRVMAVIPFADEDRSGREYCFRLADAVLASLPPQECRDAIIEECAVAAEWFHGVAGVVAAIRKLKHSQEATGPTHEELIGWATEWHPRHCDQRVNVDPSIYFRDARLMRAILAKYDLRAKR